jgi:hypothetical protein
MVSLVLVLLVERTAHVEEGFNPDSQIVYHFGYKAINENPQLYKRLISILTDTINLRCEKIRASKLPIVKFFLNKTIDFLFTSISTCKWNDY